MLFVLVAEVRVSLRAKANVRKENLTRPRMYSSSACRLLFKGCEEHWYRTIDEKLVYAYIAVGHGRRSKVRLTARLVTVARSPMGDVLCLTLEAHVTANRAAITWWLGDGHTFLGPFSTLPLSVSSAEQHVKSFSGVPSRGEGGSARVRRDISLAFSGLTAVPQSDHEAQE
jgi:hypothetical protein